MNLPRLAFANLRLNPVTSAVNIALLALGTASIVILLLFSAQLSQTLARDAKGIDLVLGAKGSPVQLVLSSVYHADVPTGNIPKGEADRWAADARVGTAVPLSLGDSYRGFRIVGTTPDYLALYQGQLAQGALWKQPMDAVLGAAVARDSQLELGDALIGSHGLVQGGHTHSHEPYRVVGILQATGTVLDRLVLTSLESVWKLHEERHHHDAAGGAHHHDDGDHAAGEREITALLIHYRSPLAATTLPLQINRESSLQAASPAFELTRLLQLIGVGLDGIRAFAAVLILSAGLGVFAALYGALKARKQDLAMLRCLGATRGELLWSLLLEGLLLAAAGALLGLALGHGIAGALGHWLAATHGAGFGGGVFLVEEAWLLLGLLALGFAAAALPAWQAYRTDVAAALAQP